MNNIKYYNIITRTNELERCITITYYNIMNLILSILSISSSIIGIINIKNNEKIISIGYILTSILSFVLIYKNNEIRIIKNIQSSFNTLRLENNELKESNKELSKTIENLKCIEKNIKEDIQILKSTIGIVEENADEMISNLKKIHEKLKKENNRHELLIKSQTSLQLMYIFHHFDKNNNLALDEIELQQAKQSILNILPNLKWDHITSQIQNNEIKLDTLLSLL